MTLVISCQLEVPTYLFPLNDCDMAKVVLFLMQSPKLFAWKTIQNLVGMMNRMWIWETGWGE